MAQKIPIGARLDPETVERFDAMAKARGSKRSEFLVFLVRRELGDKVELPVDQRLAEMVRRLEVLEAVVERFRALGFIAP